MSSSSSHKKMYKMGKDRETYRIEKNFPQNKNLQLFYLPWKFYNPTKSEITIFSLCKVYPFLLKREKKIDHEHTFSGSFRKGVGPENQ